MKCAIICGASFACGALGAIQLVVSAGCPDALMVLPLGAQEETTPWYPGGNFPRVLRYSGTRELLLDTLEKTISLGSKEEPALIYMQKFFGKEQEHQGSRVSLLKEFWAKSVLFVKSFSQATSVKRLGLLRRPAVCQT